MKKEDPDIQDVLREETSRGRRPVDVEAIRKRRRLLREIGKSIREGDEREFLRMVRALGLKDGSPEFVSVLRLWRDARRR